MLGLLLGLLAAGSAVALTSRGIYVLIEQEERAIAALPSPPPPEPEPHYQIPHQWGGPPPIVDAPIQNGRYVGPTPKDVLPQELHPHASPASLAAEPPITLPGSGVLVTPEPQPGDRQPDVVNLMQQTPFPVAGPISADEFTLFDTLKTSGRKQTEMIKLIYGASKGGTEKYTRARDRSRWCRCLPG